MADFADESAETEQVMLEIAMASRKVCARRPGFCDCESWTESLSFCGDQACRDLYERQERASQLRSGARA